jgi:hypothetical protein
MTQEFNNWWNGNDLTIDNPFTPLTPAFWAWDGWIAGRMFEAACSSLGAINDALGLDPDDGGAESIIFAIEELKRQPKEPIAWMVYSLDGMSVCVTDNPTDFTPKHKALPLYTTPPKREWVGLTDEEIFEIHKQVDSMQYLTFGKAIEAALKEKNT